MHIDTSSLSSLILADKALSEKALQLRWSECYPRGWAYVHWDLLNVKHDNGLEWLWLVNGKVRLLNSHQCIVGATFSIIHNCGQFSSFFFTSLCVIFFLGSTLPSLKTDESAKTPQHWLIDFFLKSYFLKMEMFISLGWWWV